MAAPLDLEHEHAFARDAAEANVRRLRVLVPLMVALHVGHVALFRTGASERAVLAPHILRWRDDLVLTHAVTLGFVLLLALAVVALPRTRAASLIGPAGALLYMVHGAAIAGVDQLSMTNVTVFVGYAFGIACIVLMRPLAALVVYTVGLAAFVVAIEVMQPSPDARLMVLPIGVSTVAVSGTLSMLLHGARRRDFSQRVTIGRQREELAQMNAALERRVAEQVSEIVARAREIELLNAQLHAQVRSRSIELSMALAKLARDRDADGRMKPGTILGERFVVERLIGEGGMGSVYAGTDRSTGEQVAIKVIQASSAQELDALHRFLREAGTVAKVVHPAVVRMIHVDVSADGVLFQVQELVVGHTLRSRLRPDRPWEPERVARLGSVLCSALAAAHAAGVVHRDVKPGNLMLTPQAPGLKLLDFGISKLLRARESQASSARHGVLGTPPYMAPEILNASGQPSDRSDVYAVGVVLFLSLTGSYPFDEASTRKIMLRDLVDPAPDVRDLAPAVPVELAGLVAQCLSRDPAVRPTASALSGDLAAMADALGAPSMAEVAREVASLAPAPIATEMATQIEPKGTPVA